MTPRTKHIIHALVLGTGILACAAVSTPAYPQMSSIEQYQLQQALDEQVRQQKRIANELEHQNWLIEKQVDRQRSYELGCRINPHDNYGNLKRGC